jgi:hypothetical protein
VCPRWQLSIPTRRRRRARSYVLLLFFFKNIVFCLFSVIGFFWGFCVYVFLKAFVLFFWWVKWSWGVWLTQSGIFFCVCGGDFLMIVFALAVVCYIGRYLE